ncbi:hypothetical protein WDW37_04310 [Bdellovibrionota bacterium FG-1]
MSLKDWVTERHLRPHTTTKKEISSLLAIVERDTRDAAVTGSSADARFVSAYNAALKLCTILLYASGYRTSGTGAHFHTIEAMPLILGDKVRKDADYLDSCRTNRNHAEYDFVDVVSEDEVVELILFAKQLKVTVLNWLSENHDELLP